MTEAKPSDNARPKRKIRMPSIMRVKSEHSFSESTSGREGIAMQGLSYLQREVRLFKPRKPVARAQRLPQEILLHIFNAVPRARPQPSSYQVSQLDAMRHVPLVCRSWHAPATEILYKFVSVPRTSSVFLLHRTLKENSSIRPLLKILLMPKRVWQGCPQSLMTLFIRVVDLCDSLEELQVICDLEDHQKLHGKVMLGAVRRPQYVLPVSAGRHVNLRAIALSNADQNTWTKFPIPTGVYTQLEEITLSGFRISKDIDPDTLPTLSRLKIIRYESCDLGQTDVWLLRCKQLRDLQIDLSIWEPTCRPPALLQADTLKSLQVSRGSAHYRFFEISWVAGAQNLRSLTVDWETLQKGWKHLPVCLNELCVILKDEELVDKPTYEIMLPSVEGSLKKLVLRLNKTHDGVKEKEGMIELGKKHSIEVEFDVMSFSRGAKKVPGKIWIDSAQTIRRFTKPVRASELDWETAYRKTFKENSTS